MTRLYEAADQLKKVKGQSAVARLLNESPQTVKNWETRGVSKAGTIKAQSVIGCDANWIATGAGVMAAVNASDMQAANGHRKLRASELVAQLAALLEPMDTLDRGFALEMLMTLAVAPGKASVIGEKFDRLLEGG